MNEQIRKYEHFFVLFKVIFNFILSILLSYIIYTNSHVLTFSRSHHYALIFFRGLFFLLPLCSRSHAFTPSHSLFAFKSKKHIPLCSHFFFHFTYFFFSVSSTFSTSFFFLMLSLCSHASIFFIFSFFISVSGGTLTDISLLQLFQLQHQLLQIFYSHSFFSGKHF